MSTCDVKKRNIDVQAIFPEVAEIANPALRTAVISIWEEFWERSSWNDIDTVPSSPEISYPAVPHNQCVIAMAIAIADCFERFHGVKVNRDYLIAGAVLQDVSKLLEYEPDENGKAVFSEAGKIYPHAFLAANIAMEKGVPDEVIHIILTHSPQAAKFPSSMEGKILYYVDQLDVIAIHKDRWRKELFITK